MATASSPTHADKLRQNRRDNPSTRRSGYGAFVKMATRPFEDPALRDTSPGALLALVISLARGGHFLETSAASLAVRLGGGCHPCTVRRRLNLLDRQRYLWVESRGRRGDIRIWLTSRGKAAPFSAHQGRNKNMPNRPPRPTSDVSRADLHSTNQQDLRKIEGKKPAQEEVGVRPAQPTIGIPSIVPGRPVVDAFADRRGLATQTDSQRRAAMEAAGRGWAAEERQRSFAKLRRPGQSHESLPTSLALRRRGRAIRSRWSARGTS